MKPSADAFRQFSTAFYARPGVADCCLALQDDHGVRVNPLLLACCLSRSLLCLPVTGWQQVLATTQEFHHARVRALREARRRLPSGAGREQALREEIEAEFAEQAALLAALPEAWLQPMDSLPVALQANLMACWAAACPAEPAPVLLVQLAALAESPA